MCLMQERQLSLYSCAGHNFDTLRHILIMFGPQWHSQTRVQLVIRRLWVGPPPGWQHSYVEIDHEIFSVVILSLLLIEEEQFSVSGKGMRLEDQACPVKVWLGKHDPIRLTGP